MTDGQEYLKYELLYFFMWFRDNGEHHYGSSIEKMIEKYLDVRKQRIEEDNKWLEDKWAI